MLKSVGGGSPTALIKNDKLTGIIIFLVVGPITRQSLCFAKQIAKQKFFKSPKVLRIGAFKGKLIYRSNLPRYLLVLAYTCSNRINKGFVKNCNCLCMLILA